MEEVLYYKASRFYRERYGKCVQRICLDGGFTCPNRDGTVGLLGVENHTDVGSLGRRGDQHTRQRYQKHCSTFHKIHPILWLYCISLKNDVIRSKQAIKYTSNIS